MEMIGSCGISFQVPSLFPGFRTMAIQLPETSSADSSGRLMRSVLSTLSTRRTVNKPSEIEESLWFVSVSSFRFIVMKTSCPGLLFRWYFEATCKSFTWLFLETFLSSPLSLGSILKAIYYTFAWFIGVIFLRLVVERQRWGLLVWTVQGRMVKLMSKSKDE